MPLQLPQSIPSADWSPSYQAAPGAATTAAPPPGDARIGPWPYAAAIGGQAADALSSLYNFGRGYGESNFGGSKGAALASKAAIAAVMPLLMRHLATTGHPTAAKTLGYLVGAAGAVPAAVNLAQPNLPGR